MKIATHWKSTAIECAIGRTISVCTWVQHAVIAAILGLAVLALSHRFGVDLRAPAWLLITAGFFVREHLGGGAFKSRDSIGDWVSPMTALFALFSAWGAP